MQKQNLQIPHDLPKKRPPKKVKKVSRKKKLGDAVGADQVQGRLGHGEIEEGDKKKQNFLSREAFALHK